MTTEAERLMTEAIEEEKQKITVVVTRHPALIRFLVEQGIVNEKTPVISHAKADDIEGKHVIGVLPMHMAALALTITEVPLNIPAELRGKELDLEQVRAFAGEPVTYSVRTAENIRQISFRIGNCVAAGSTNWDGNGTEDDILRFHGLPARCGTRDNLHRLQYSYVDR
jgi:putative CRISPR-associated protein (TIGR02620 family)